MLAEWSDGFLDRDGKFAKEDTFHTPELKLGPTEQIGANMSRLKDIYPTAQQVVEASLLDLCQAVLQCLSSKLQRPQDAECAYNFLLGIGTEYGNGKATLACSEAWSWLYANGFITHHPEHDTQWMTLTRMAREVVAEKQSVTSWTLERQFPEEMLHASLRSTALRLYKQQMFDNAVFEAFKTLEVAIRCAAGLGDEWIGTKLTARAFNPEDGPLTDGSAEAGERQALMNLMSGAIGSYKNPHSHRRVDVGPVEAREMIIMASHLLGIIDSRGQGAIP